MPNFVRDGPGGLFLAVKLQPRASRNEIGDPIGDELRIKVTAPAVEFAANEALIRLLAATLGCSKGRLEIVRGEKSRHKLIRLSEFKAEEVAKLLGKQE